MKYLKASDFSWSLWGFTLERLKVSPLWYTWVSAYSWSEHKEENRLQSSCLCLQSSSLKTAAVSLYSSQKLRRVFLWILVHCDLWLKEATHRKNSVYALNAETGGKHHKYRLRSKDLSWSKSNWLSEPNHTQHYIFKHVTSYKLAAVILYYIQ